MELFLYDNGLRHERVKWCSFHLRYKTSLHGRIINWGGLTTLLSIFLFLRYLFISLTASIYILMIYQWSKVRAWFTFWFNIKEIQPPKYSGKNLNPIFLDSTLFWVSFVSSCMKWTCRIYCLCLIQFVFHSLSTLNGILLGL